ncbi:hypothetical protein X734_00695 [Mesorhizobium sp. L2C084A000]|nr:hypothetical protein X734_00695 [Mesorhizobium sp. L2C084A000]
MAKADDDGKSARWKHFVSRSIVTPSILHRDDGEAFRPADHPYEYPCVTPVETDDRRSMGSRRLRINTKHLESLMIS